jgi:uncharacterized membrane protein
MMGFNGSWGYASMMGSIGSLGFIVWLVVLIDLILVGVWLWQQITRK